MRVSATTGGAVPAHVLLAFHLAFNPDERVLLRRAATSERIVATTFGGSYGPLGFCSCPVRTVRGPEQAQREYLDDFEPNPSGVFQEWFARTVETELVDPEGYVDPREEPGHASRLLLQLLDLTEPEETK
jgi:hypothetical protein